MLASSPSEFYPVLAVKLARNLVISSQQSAISGAFVPGLMGGESRHLLIKKDRKIMRDFREIKVWSKAHQLTLAIYKATSAFPRAELYGLTSQLRRSAASSQPISQKALEGAVILN
jgi:hypothetical protein